MFKLIPAIMLFSVSTFAAESCFPLYEKKAKEIQDKDGYSKEVGGQFYVNQGQLGYWPGVKVAADIDNWAEDLVDAIKWGPFVYTSNPDDPRKSWLETFRKSIDDDCKLPKENYDQLRSMLKELMDDGSFCPGNKILEPKFLKGKSEFKKILKQAVADNRFPQHCQGKEVADDSHREIKDVSGDSKTGKNKSEASKQ